jgi:hypothetical protein
MAFLPTAVFTFSAVKGNPEHPYGIYPDHDYYNPVTDSWHRLENMPIPVHGVTGMAFIKGLIHLTGGGTTQGGASGTTLHQVYKPAMSCKVVQVQGFKSSRLEMGEAMSLPFLFRDEANV